MKRTGFLERSGWINAKRATPRRSSAVKDPAFLAFVHTLCCHAATLGPCRGDLQAHHAGPRGLGQKCRDDEAIAMCDGHHDLFHDGPVRDWPECWRTKEDRRAWVRAAIASTQALYIERGGVLIPAGLF